MSTCTHWGDKGVIECKQWTDRWTRRSMSRSVRDPSENSYEALLFIKEARESICIHDEPLRVSRRLFGLSQADLA
jgi:hypothetical protein